MSPLYARLAAQILVDEAPQPASVSDADRARAIATVAAAMAAREERRRRMRRGLIVLSLAASVLVVVGAVRMAARPEAPSATLVPPADTIVTPLADDVRVLHGEAVRTIAEGTPLVPGDHVIVGGADRAHVARVTLPTGTRLALEGASELAMTESDPSRTIFTLARGAVRADVAKLRAGERFLIRTADAEVEVRGTSFRVEVLSCPNGAAPVPRTRVEVTEGTVVVRGRSQETALHPGQSWSEECAPAAPLETSAKAPPLRAPRPPPREPARPAKPEIAREQERAISDLAAQNNLFAEAMRQKQQQEFPAAMVTLDRFLATYPTSTLAESALAERMKILGTSMQKHPAETSRARAAASDYLKRYPGGFARADAEKILGPSP